MCIGQKIENIFKCALDRIKPKHSRVLRIRKWFRNKVETNIVNLIPKITIRRYTNNVITNQTQIF